MTIPLDVFCNRHFIGDFVAVPPNEAWNLADDTRGQRLPVAPSKRPSHRSFGAADLGRRGAAGVGCHATEFMDK
jgi:hypothetical protein